VAADYRESSNLPGRHMSAKTNLQFSGTQRGEVDEGSHGIVPEKGFSFSTARKKCQRKAGVGGWFGGGVREAGVGPGGVGGSGRKV